MDMTLVNLKFKKNANGTQCIAYCDEYPQVLGTGPTESHAQNNFWKAFNTAQAKEEEMASQQKRAAATPIATDNKNKNKKKKAA